MKELIIFNIILLITYCFISYKLLSESYSNAFFSIAISKMIIILILPIILCLLNQIFMLFWEIDRLYIWFTFLYLIPPAIKIVSDFIENYKAEKFYEKYHNEIVNFINEYLNKYDSIKGEVSVLVFLDTSSKQLGTHKVILKNFKTDDSFIKELRQELFYKFHLDFDIFYKNI